MARSDYVESPRSSRRNRKNSHPIPPPAPEVEWFQPVGEEPHSPPHQTCRTTVRRTVVGDRDWDNDDEEIPPRTPESRTSSSSYHASRPLGRRSEHRRDRSTPSRSVASSRTSVHTLQPPRTSMHRPSDYRRPTVSLRDGASAGYEDDRSRDRNRSQSRPRSYIVSTPLSRRTSRTFEPHSQSESYTADESDTSFDSQEEEDRAPRSRAEHRLVPISRAERSRSRYDAARRSDRQYRRRGEPARPVDEDFDDADSRQTPSLHEAPPPRTPSRSRSHPRAQSRSRSRAVSVRRIQQHQLEDHVYERDDNIDDDASAEEDATHDFHERFDRPTGSHKNRRSRTREHRRAKSEMLVKQSPPSKRSSPKRYYETEVVEVEKRVRPRPPSASVRRPNTVHGSVAASQHQSVSSSTKRPSPNFFERLLGPPLPKYRHRAPEKPKKLVECLICMDDLEPRKTVKLKCGHRMCNPCLKRSFKLSVTDSQHMPPKCCTKDNIPLKHVERLFSNDFKKTWNKKFREYSHRNRVYCPRKYCGEHIRSEDIQQLDDGRKYWRCGKCKTKVCIQCNAKYHRGRDCPNDEDTAKIVAQAKDEGWQRCYRCKAMVELMEGCNHMTCRCGAQFCMICGSRWRTCECAWFNYDTVESDRLQHMQVPREPFGGRLAAEVPLSPQREARSGRGSGLQPRPRSYEEEMRTRRLQEDSDAAYARRLQAIHDFGNEREDDLVVGGFGGIHGIGNAAGHFMNEDFRPRPRNLTVPQPPPPHAPVIPLEPPAFDRAPPGDYIQGVNRARGVRATSLNRLADRFNPESRQSVAHRPPPALQTSQTMPLPVMTPAVGPALAPGPTVLPMRRHTGGSDAYIEETRPRTGGTRSVERVTGSGRTKRPVIYDEPEEISLRHGGVAREEPRASAMAGLTDGLKGRLRVDEWREHVSPGKPLGPS